MKQKVFDLLESLQIPYTNYEHIPVFTCDDAKWVEVPGKRVKSLLLRNEKKTRYYMVVLEDYKRLDIKQFAQKVNDTKMSFASESTMIEKIGVTPGHVSPFAMINNLQKDIQVVFDSELQNTTIGIHPLQNDNTVVILQSDVEKYLSFLWVEYRYISF